MAEIKVFCLHCGQHIQCDEGYRGVQINCPSCNQSFSVPAAQPIAPPPLSAANPPVKHAWLLVAGKIVCSIVGIFFLLGGLFSLFSGDGAGGKIIGFIFCISLSILYFCNSWNLHLASQGKKWRLVGHIWLIWPLAIIVDICCPTPNKEKKKTNWYVVVALAALILIIFALLIWGIRGATR